MIIPAYIMLLLHLLYDFHWQGDFIAKNKHKYLFIMLVHCITWGMLLYIPLFIYLDAPFIMLVFLVVTYYMVDYWKSGYPTEEKYFWTLYVDQGIHLLTMFIALYYSYSIL